MKIWQTYRNSDDIEGRGPMVPDLAFLHKEHAEKYIDNQPGVMGRRAQWSKQKYGDWMIKEIPVFDYDVIEAGEKLVKLKLRALSKLTDEELKILGLDKLTDDEIKALGTEI
jgi:hypothetical protein